MNGCRSRARFSAAMSGAGTLAAACPQLDRTIRDADAESGADRAFYQTNVTAMRARQFGRNGKAKPGAAGAGRALERLEHMLARLIRNSRASVGNLDHHHRAFTAA